MPHRQHVEAAAEFEPLGLAGEPGAELDQIGQAFIALALEMMLGGPQRVEAERVHLLGDVARRGEGLAQPLAGIAPVVRRGTVEPDLVELDLADIEHMEMLDHDARASLTDTVNAAASPRRFARVPASVAVRIAGAAR
jgi:hypothetical protein